MKQWKGYLTAGIFAAFSALLHVFAATHTILVDMVYPYIARMIQTTLSSRLGGGTVGIWNIFVLVFAVAVIVLCIVLKKKGKSILAFLGWVLAVISVLFFLQTGIFGLSRYAGGLQEDMRIDIKDYTVTELEEATTYFRDQALALQSKVTDESFSQLAARAVDGFDALQYEDADSVFAGSRVEVKRMIPGTLIAQLLGSTGRVTPLTGEAYVNYMLPEQVLPWGICYQMAYRMSIVADGSPETAAFFACIENSDDTFRYSGYLMAYSYCLAELKTMNTATAKAAVTRLESGQGAALSEDVSACGRYLKNRSETCTLLVCWHIQEISIPAQSEGESDFDPLDSTQVDISDILKGR